MKKKYFLIIILLIFIIDTIFIFSNDFCKPPKCNVELLKYLRNNKVLSLADNYVVRIFIHIIRQNDGSGGQTQNEVNNAINILIADYITEINLNLSDLTPGIYN